MTKKIRCHACGLQKVQETGKYVCWNFGIDDKQRIIVWFHNNECKEKWLNKYKKQDYEEVEHSEQVGIMSISGDVDRIDFGK